MAPTLQRGNGLGSIFRGLMRFIVPAFKTVAKKPIVRQVARSAMKTGVRTLSDVLDGEKASVALKRNSKVATQRLLEQGIKHLKAGSTQSVPGRRSKRQLVRNSDIFSKNAKRGRM